MKSRRAVDTTCRTLCAIESQGSHRRGGRDVQTPANTKTRSECRREQETPASWVGRGTVMGMMDLNCCWDPVMINENICYQRFSMARAVSCSASVHTAQFGQPMRSNPEDRAASLGGCCNHRLSPSFITNRRSDKRVKTEKELMRENQSKTKIGTQREGHPREAEG